MTWYNIWRWPIEIYDDIRLWFVVKAALKESETIQALKSFKYELRMDNIGRIYTVINVPEELWPYENRDQVWPWMVEQLSELDEILMSRQLNDIVYPTVTKIEAAPSYLVVLAPSAESLSFAKFFRWLFNLGFVCFSAFAVDKIFHKIMHQSVVEFLVSILS